MTIEIGMVIPFAGASAPGGYLLCDGASYLRSSYSALFGVIGTVFGSADGTHFNVPDLRGRAVYGVGSGVGGGVSGTGAPVGDDALNTGESEPPVGKVIPTIALGDWFGRTEMYQHPDQLVEHQHSVDQVAHAHSFSGSPHNHTQDAHSHTVYGNAVASIGTQRRALAASSNDDVSSVNATATNQAATASGSVGSTTPESVDTGYAGDNVPFDVLSPGVGLNYLIKT